MDDFRFEAPLIALVQTVSNHDIKSECDPPFESSGITLEKTSLAAFIILNLDELA